MKHERICVVCGKHYAYCPACDEYKDLPKWMFAFCSENCKDIYSTFNALNAGTISEEDAKARFKELDISAVVDENIKAKLAVLFQPDVKKEEPKQDFQPEIRRKHR